MPGNTFGILFQVTTWGESHGPALGAVIDGCPAGLELSEKDIQRDLDRRRPGQSEITCPRKETDKVEILSGLFKGKTTGMPLALLIRNKDARPEDYQNLKDLFRPGHADFTYQLKYGIRDYRGGGRASGRETVARVAAGAIAKKILARGKTRIIAYTKQVHKIPAEEIDFKNLDRISREIEKNPLRCPDQEAAEKMLKFVLAQKEKGDSVGGVIEILVRNPPSALGEPVFDKLEADLAKALMSIGAVKGIELGPGFKVAELLGSENNRLKTGTLGGISTGEDLIIRIAVKPPSSIGKPQKMRTKQGKEVTLEIKGRHDVCLLPRIIPVAESMVALVLADHYLRQKVGKI